MYEKTVTVVEAIREIRAQLVEAAVEGKGQSLRFVPKSVEVELSVTFKLEASVGGGFKLLSLIDMSGKATAKDENVHKIKLVLEPVGTDGKPVYIGDTILEK